MYQVYSKYYDKIEATSQEVVNFILANTREYFPGAKSMLEIGCGTGNNLISLKESFDVSGLDISSEMLTIAKTKLPEVKFFIGDMSNFNLEQKFDLIVSMYDSINHLKNFESWRECFESVHKHLNTNGLFIFDVNTLFKLNTMSESPEFEVEVDEKILKMKVSKIAENSFDWGIQILNKEKDPGLVSGDFAVESETIQETAFALDSIENLLRDCQFELLKTVELSGNPATEKSNRAYFVCRKI